jgi:ABC-type multidrug transport system ATPase subunit
MRIVCNSDFLQNLISTASNLNFCQLITFRLGGIMIGVPQMTRVLACNDIRKFKKRPLVNPVSFELNQGEGLAVCGYNGSGKTTLLDIIAGLIEPDEGRVNFKGSVGYVMQHPGFQESLSVKDNLHLEAALCGLRGQAAIDRISLVADKCGLVDFFNTRYSKCSAGMQAKLSIAASLMPSPNLLLLDEAFNALDDMSRFRMKELFIEMKREGTALIFVSHNKEDFIGLCDRMMTLPSCEMVPT